MNVSTLAVPEETAIKQISDIEALNPKLRTQEDDELLALFKAVRKHNTRIIAISKAFQQTGLNQLGQPKLAIARADWPTVIFSANGDSRLQWEPCRYFYRSGKFSEAGKPTDRSSTVRLGRNVFPEFVLPKFLRSAVPHIPAAIRPKYKLNNYHILFEVEEWDEVYPVDPFLLKHVVGDIYIVLAEWELTELEASLLGSMRSGS